MYQSVLVRCFERPFRRQFQGASATQFCRRSYSDPIAKMRVPERIIKPSERLNAIKLKETTILDKSVATPALFL